MNLRLCLRLYLFSLSCRRVGASVNQTFFVSSCLHRLSNTRACAAQKVAQRLLVGLDPNKPLPNDEFTNYCCLLFDLNFLYRRVADIVQAIHAEKLSKKADVLSLNNSSGTAAVAVSFAGTEEECDTLKWWSGLTDRPLQTDRVQLPLLPSNTPTWIGIIFSPGKPSMLKTFSVHVALGGGKGEAEPIKYVIPGVPEWTHEANSGPGIAFCCKISKNFETTVCCVVFPDPRRKRAHTCPSLTPPPSFPGCHLQCYGISTRALLGMSCMKGKRHTSMIGTSRSSLST